MRCQMCALVIPPGGPRHMARGWVVCPKCNADEQRRIGGVVGLHGDAMTAFHNLLGILGELVREQEQMGSVALLTRKVVAQVKEAEAVLDGMAEREEVRR